jgi:transcriptional regulator with XRE-family HTH domain
MTETFLLNDPQVVARLNSVACILEWTRSMSVQERKRFLGALIECSDDVQQVVVSLLNVVKDPSTAPAERKQALMTIADALSLNPCEEDGQRGQEDAFAQRLRELMDAKQVSQLELAERVGCSQPAISQMLNRKCRPQKRTILKLAEALKVHPRELWPDIDVADMLDAVASFQEDGYTMTAAEASALAGTANKNRPKVRAKSLPARL